MVGASASSRRTLSASSTLSQSVKALCETCKSKSRALRKCLSVWLMSAIGRPEMSAQVRAVYVLSSSTLLASPRATIA
jgi:hypothetical protein